MANNNSTLHDAKTAKQDEFYTRLEDINAEMRFYAEHFNGKTVFCNCDDPLVSNFVLYFGLNFHRLGLKRLIAICFRNEDPTRFSFGSKKNAHGTVLDYYGEIGAEEVADDFIEKLKPYCKPMKGNGDFRSEESLSYLEQCDIICSNPPFSLFREYIHTLEEYGKKYIVLGNMNAITYKEIFPLIKGDKLWIGGTGIHDMSFIVPNDYEMHSTRSWRDEKGVNWRSLGNVCWFTNLDHKKRHEGVYLIKKYDSSIYPRYDNYDAIEVSKVADIPMGYDGVMGVPITFLDKYNPEQFEIVDARDFALYDKQREKTTCLIKDKDGSINGKPTYARICIHRRPEWNQDEHF